MPTLCMRFRFRENGKIAALMEACRAIQQEAIDFAWENKKTATFTLIKALYPSLKAQYPHLHTQWLQSAVRSAATVVHSFRNRKRKGKTNAERPHVRRPFVYVSKPLLKIAWDGKMLTVTFPVVPRDKEPVVLSFRPHHKYSRLLDEWKAGRAELGEPTLTRTSFSIPLKFPDAACYEPTTALGIDSNETNLTISDGALREVREIDTGYAAKASRDHDRRVRKGTKGKQNPKARRKVAAKHGRRRREKVTEFWHHIALLLIAQAMAAGAALVLEELKGIKGRIAREHKSRRLRQRLLNFWNIMAFHRILSQKAKRYGVPVIFVDPSNTSRTCPVCDRMNKLRGHVLLCSCGLEMGRQEVGAINIARRGMEKLFGGLVLPEQGLVGDPGGLSSDFGLKARSHDRNAQPTA
jgi:putative transposase